MIEKYSLANNQSLLAAGSIMFTAMNPFLRTNVTTKSIEKTTGGIQEPFTSMRKVFEDVVNIFKGINRENEKQNTIFDRIERSEDENRQERTNIIRQTTIKEDTNDDEEENESGRISLIVRAVLNVIRRVVSTIRRVVSTIISAFRRLVGAIVTLARNIARILLGIIRVLGILRRRFPLAFVVGEVGYAFGLFEPIERLIDALENFVNAPESGAGQSSGAGAPARQYAARPDAPSATGQGQGEGRREGVSEGGIGNILGTEATAMNFFMDNGFTREQAAGIVGNLIQESKLNPRAHNMRYNENSQGIAQWNPAGGRQENIKEYLGKPILEATFQEQLRAVLWELNGNGMDRGARQAGIELRRATTADQAAEIFMRLYERPHIAHGNLPARAAHARRLAIPTPNPQPTPPADAQAPQGERHSSVVPDRYNERNYDYAAMSSNRRIQQAYYEPLREIFILPIIRV